MLRKSCKRHQSFTVKSFLDSQDTVIISNKNKNSKTQTIKKQHQFNELIKQINNFKQKVVKLSTNKSKNSTPKKQKANFQQSKVVVSSYTNETPKQTVSQPFQYINKNNGSQQYNIDKLNYISNRPTCQLSRRHQSQNKNDVAQIHLIIKNKSNEDNVKELAEKVQKLQEKNEYLNQQKMILEHKLLFEQQQKRQLSRIIESQETHFHKDYSRKLTISNIKQSRNDQSPIRDNNLSAYRQKSPFYKYQLDQSRNCQNSKIQIKQDRSGTLSSLEQQSNPLNDKETHWSRLKAPNTCYIQKYRQKGTNSFSNHTTQLRRNQNYLNNLNLSKMSDQKKSTAKLNQSLQYFQEPDSRQCSIREKQSSSIIQQIFYHNSLQPRITFSKDAIAPRKVSIEVDTINNTTEDKKLIMLEKYFERLISFSQMEKDRNKKNEIRKEMCEISVEIHQLRKKLNL